MAVEIPIVPDQTLLMNKEASEILRDRRHPVLLEKDRIYRMIADDYDGSWAWMQVEEYLWKHPKENRRAYNDRRKRATPWLHAQEVADTLSGFLFTTEPERTAGTGFDEFIKKATKNKSLNKLMMNIATKSLMFPVGVLIDTPDFDPEFIVTEADRISAQIKPFAVMYNPWEIRDFNFDTNGELDWVMLDNTRQDAGSPFQSRQPIDEFVIWDKNMWINVTFKKTKGTGAFMQAQLTPHNHGLGRVPFKIINWRDQDEDGLAESTQFEGLALEDRVIFNYRSMLDEMVTGGTFKMLFYPTESGKIPRQLLVGGQSELTVVPFKGDLTHKPYYDGAKMEEAGPFLNVINASLTSIQKMLNLDRDEDKAYVQSGEAKRRDLQRTETLLRAGAASMQDAEQWMVEMVDLWNGRKPTEKKVIEYIKKFADDQINDKLDRLYRIIEIQKKKVTEKAKKAITRLTFPETTEAELTELLKDDTNAPDGPKVDPQKRIDNLAAAEEAARANQPSTKDGQTEEVQNGPQQN